MVRLLNQGVALAWKNRWTFDPIEIEPAAGMSIVDVLKALDILLGGGVTSQSFQGLVIGSHDHGATMVL